MTAAGQPHEPRPFAVHLVRHGRAAAGWDAHADPGLDARGRAQAQEVADRLVGSVALCAVVSSPLARARQTAAPLAERWSARVQLDGAFGEVPSPTADLTERASWLRAALVGTWDDLGPEVADWRQGVIGAAIGLGREAVVFTHFVAINALVGWAESSDLVTTFAPANASVTELRIVPGAVAGDQVTVVRRGAEAAPEVG